MSCTPGLRLCSPFASAITLSQQTHKPHTIHTSIHCNACIHSLAGISALSAAAAIAVYNRQRREGHYWSAGGRLSSTLAVSGIRGLLAALSAFSATLSIL